MKAYCLAVLIAFAAVTATPVAAQTSTTKKTTTTTKTTAKKTTTKSKTSTAKKSSTTKEKKMSTAGQVAVLHTTEGDIAIRFFPDVAPNHVANFVNLAQKGFYNGTKFHRVIPGFMIQGGDPNTKTDNTSTWGTGGSGVNVKAEFNTVSHKRGIVSMARSNDPNSASSQFFIVTSDSTFLDRQYTAFGQVLSGMDVADKIVNAPRGAQDRPNKPVAIKSITLRPATAAESGPAPK